MTAWVWPSITSKLASSNFSTPRPPPPSSPAPESRMVSTAIERSSSSTAPPVGFDSISSIVSLGSGVPSATIGTLKERMEPSPGPQVKVPETSVKSSPASAVPACAK